MTILFLLFLSGLVLQGLKMLVSYAISQMKVYVENYDEASVELFSGKTNRINLDVLVFNEGRNNENYAFVTSSTEGNNRMKRTTYPDSAISERSFIGSPG